MSKIVIIGAGAMGTAFAFPCLDNNHDINIIGTHLENDFIDSVLKNKRLHPGLNANIPESVNLIKYENFDAINVNKTKDIPLDFNGKMGVPITFLNVYNPKQFEILGHLASTNINEFNFGYPYINGKRIYARIIIKNKRL